MRRAKLGKQLRWACPLISGTSDFALGSGGAARKKRRFPYAQLLGRRAPSSRLCNSLPHDPSPYSPLGKLPGTGSDSSTARLFPHSRPLAPRMLHRFPDGISRFSAPPPARRTCMRSNSSSDKACAIFPPPPPPPPLRLGFSLVRSKRERKKESRSLALPLVEKYDEVALRRYHRGTRERENGCFERRSLFVCTGERNSGTGGGLELGGRK